MMHIGKVSDWVNDKTPSLNLLHLTLKPMQTAIVRCALTHDVIVNLPTGYGKSLLFQWRAHKLKGKCIVLFVPLVALIWDCIKEAHQLNISMAKADSETVDLFEQYNQLPQVLVLTPEKLFINSRVFNFVQSLHAQGRIEQFVVDQAHCISEWGADFRPHYMELGRLRAVFPGPRIMALSATIPPEARADLVKRLQVPGCYYFQASLNRPNLIYSVELCSLTDLARNLMKFLKQKKLQDQQGIVYCQSIKWATKLQNELETSGLTCEVFHSKVTENKRLQLFSRFMEGELKVLVCTICFGMGINKKDIRFVIHAGIAGSVQAYYQESGRAGRDGLPSHCRLFSYPRDDMGLNFLTQQSQMTAKLKRQKYIRIQSCKQYASEIGCRKKLMFRLLGEIFDDCRETCDFCLGEVTAPKVKEVDITQAAFQIVRELQKYPTKYYTEKQLAKHLTAKSTENNKKQWNLPPASLAGFLKGKNQSIADAYVNAIISSNLLVPYQQKVSFKHFVCKYYVPCSKADLMSCMRVLAKIPDVQKQKPKQTIPLDNYLATKAKIQQNSSKASYGIEQPKECDMIPIDNTCLEYLESLLGEEYIIHRKDSSGEGSKNGSSGDEMDACEQSLIRDSVEVDENHIAEDNTGDVFDELLEKYLSQKKSQKENDQNNISITVTNNGQLLNSPSVGDIINANLTKLRHQNSLSNSFGMIRSINSSEAQELNRNNEFSEYSFTPQLTTGTRKSIANSDTKNNPRSVDSYMPHKAKQTGQVAIDVLLGLTRKPNMQTNSSKTQSSSHMKRLWMSDATIHNKIDGFDSQVGIMKQKGFEPLKRTLDKYDLY